jgi:serine/threonine-protein kinase
MEKLRDQAEDPLIGCTLPGGHVVLELIDVGGMGRVYRAEQKMLGRTVAVKIIHPHLLGDETVEARFITEARAASQLNHPNSVGVIDFGKFDGRLYMVMEYLRGRDLATVAHEEGPLDVERVVDILLQTLAALEEAHAIGIIHRDLKPENIVLSPLRSGGDFVKVLDFGLAKVLEAAATKRITDPGMVCGTPEYMAPEQARGDNVDHRVDLYACGVILFELLAGQLPFDGTSPREIVLMHLSKPPPDLRRLVPDRQLSAGIIEVVYKALAKDPRDRFQNAAQLGAALKHTLSPEEPVETRRRTAETMHRCPACRAMMPTAQKFCGECGTALFKRRSDQEQARDAVVRDKAGLPLPFTGREAELGWLFERRAKVGGALAAATVSGPAGVGKTRLLREFLDKAGHRGDTVVSVRPDPWWCSRGFHAVRQAIGQLAALPDDGGEPSRWSGATPDARAGLEAVFDRRRRKATPEQKRGWTVSPPESVDSSTRLLVAEALRWAIEQAHNQSGGRIIVAVDDLHALDGASLNAFTDVVAEPPLAAALLIGAHPSSFQPAWEGASMLELRGLPTHIAAELVRGEPSLLAGAAAADGDGARDLETALVAPMYLEQLVRYTREGGEEPPQKLADLVALRIERLDAQARRLLQAIAVLGDAARSAQLVALLPDMGDMGQHMAVLRQAGFVDVHGPEAASSHPLIRDIVLTSIPHAVRGELHARARRDFGEAELASPIEADAIHAYYGGSSFEALMLLEQVAERCNDRNDTAGAINAFRMAIELARREMVRGELDDPLSALLMFHCKLGDALLHAGKLHDAEGILREALSLAGPQDKERPRILASLASVARGGGRPGDAYAHLDEALSIAEKSHQTELVDSLEEMRQRWVAGL